MVIFQTHVLLLCPLSKMAIVAKIINILLFIITLCLLQDLFAVIFPSICSNIPAVPVYGRYIPELAVPTGISLLLTRNLLN
jgi:hypothetical protein